MVAKTLGVDLSMVSVKPTSSLANANSSVTGGAMSSELNCYVSKILRKNNTYNLIDLTC